MVGADGLHSAVRRLAFADEARFVHHLGMYVALVEVSPDSGGQENWVTFYTSPGRMAGIACYRDQTYAVYIFRSPELRYDYPDVKEKKQKLIAAFAHESSWDVPGCRTP